MAKLEDDNYALIAHPKKLVPWARPGWFDKASAWIEQQLASQGYNIVAPIEQLHVRVWSTILRVSTSSGMLYFKASGPSFAYEPALTQVLSEHWPACIPHVIAVDLERTWILMEDAAIVKELARVVEQMLKIRWTIPTHAAP